MKVPCRWPYWKPKDGSDDRLKALAQKMQETQKSEIEQLDKFLEDNKNAPKNYDPENKNEGFGKVLHKNMMMVMDAQGEMRGSTDQQFVKMMIPHHQTALYMAEGFLQYGKNEMLKSISRKMIQDQNQEIEELKNTEQAR